MDNNIQKEDIEQEPITPSPELIPTVICQFTFHPVTGEITLEVAKDLDIFDLVKCKRALVEQLEDAEMNLWNALFKGQQQMLAKQNATLEGMRELLKASMLSKTLEEANKVKPNKSKLVRVKE